jgi:cytochrome oxidase assembly protein ShyY1
MYRFLLRPKWILFHLLVAAAIVAMINLGFWQLRRLDERRTFNRAVEAAIDQPVAPLDDVLTAGTDPAAVEWRPVVATGTYLPDEQFAVVNRSQDGQAGDMTVTPLRLDDGRILLVERGFVPLGETGEPAPSERVEVVGRLRRTQERHHGGLSDPAEGDLTEAHRVDIGRLTPQLPGDVVPMFVELVDSSPAERGPYPLPPSEPELTERNHLSYAVQWFIFSVCAAVGWVLAVRHSAQARRSPPPSAPADEPTEVRA